MTPEQLETPGQEDMVEDFAAMLAAHETTSSRLQAGQKVSGTIITIAGDSVFVDVGIKVDGIMERKDILDAEGKETAAPGDTIEAWVIGVSAQEIRLSRSMSGSGVAALEEARDAALPVDGRVTGTVKGGYSVEVLGKTAFCPGSQMEATAPGDAESLVGRTMQFLVTRVENRGRNIVVSRRALLEREREENLAKLLENLNEGDTVEGRISRLAAFGAFVELAPAVEGMIHLSELSWARVGAPDEAVAPGELVRAKVLGITRNDKGQVRISLSRKQVVRLVPFGAFVELLPGIEGLVHISEMSWAKRVGKPEDVLTTGETVSVKIKDINTASRRISLSLRDAEGDPWQDATQRFAVGSNVTGIVESRSQYGLFVSLAPGITGLLPAGVIKNSKNGSEFSKLDKGAEVTLTVQNLDTAARRISLAPVGSELVDETEDKAWKQHASVGAPAAAGGLGIMAQALQKALQKK